MPLDELTQIRHVLLHCGGPEIRTVLEDAKHVINVEARTSVFSVHQDNRLVVRHSDTEFEHDIRVVFGQVTDYEISSDQFGDNRRLDHVTALTISRFDVEVARRGRNDTPKNLREEPLWVFRVPSTTQESRMQSCLNSTHSLTESPSQGRLDRLRPRSRWRGRSRHDSQILTVLAENSGEFLVCFGF